MKRLVWLLAMLAPAPAAAQPFRDALSGGGDGPELVRVAPGRVSLGSRPDDPGYTPMERVHTAELSPFAVGTREITNEEFCRFLNEEGNREDRGVRWLRRENPSEIEERGGKFTPRAGTARHPVVRVTWQGALAFCRWLSQKTGHRYELPTAAQWEAVARAGQSTTWPWGAADDPARYHARAEGAADVGSFPANAWGVYDMIGNVWEWTRDCFQPDAFAFLPLHDPVYFEADCSAPEIRGGGFRDGGALCRPGFRTNAFWGGAYDQIGFRVVRLDVGDKP